jgi:hypothetical protein
MRHRITFTIALLGLLSCGRTATAGGADLPVPPSGLRGAEVGKLHDDVLEALLRSGLPLGPPVTEDELAAILAYAGAEAFQRTDVAALARDMGITTDQASAFVASIVTHTASEGVRLFRESGALEPCDRPQRQSPGGCTEVRPLPRGLLDVLDQVVREGLLSPQVGSELATIVESAWGGSYATAGDMFSDARRRLGGNRWSGADRLAADAFLSVLLQSYHFWQGQDLVEMPGTGSEGGVTTFRIGLKEVAALDAIGGAIGATIGGAGGFVGGSAVAIATGGIGLPAIVAGTLLGAGAGGAIMGGAMSGIGLMSLLL